jgi:hypothetical protein
MLMHRAIVLVVCVALQFPIAAAAQPPQASYGPVPSGLVVVIENAPASGPLDISALSNPYISGVALQIHWSDIEPIEGKPDWTTLDSLFAAAKSSKKWVQLLLFPGFFSPAWALQGVQTDRFPIPYGPGTGTVETLPMPWDSAYLSRWFAFLKLLSDRYGSLPTFRMVAAVGPTSVSAEFTLPNSPADLKQWQSDGYTPSKYIAAWQKTFGVYADDFPNQFVSLSVGFGLSINDRGKVDPREHLRTKQAIVDQAMSTLGGRFALQLSDLHAGPTREASSSAAEDQYVIGYNGRITTGFQMRSSAEGAASTAMGAAGNPPLALRRSIDLAMVPNGAGQHINYLEIYEPDVLASKTQSVLRYGASLLAPRPPTRPH